jgi:hypothetical protein
MLPRVRLDDLRLALDDEAQGASDGDHGQRLEGGVQRQAPHAAAPKQGILWWTHEFDGTIQRPHHLILES